ncbi:PaaI family thioesterase [Haloechinothrix halophila]|uniref:PaaI family thioesterase n=1 Tax=Haloechinothrix halophila TaxID=1069073 RepID=UPI001E2EEB34|nr:PaaI family thioesterase [Haloechinothrix halophila]
MADSPDRESHPHGHESHRGVPGARDAGLTAPEDTGELRRRRESVATLGARLRELTEVAIRAEVPVEVLDQAAAEIESVTVALRERQREPSQAASVDDLIGGVRMFNPVIGTGHPGAPPVEYFTDGDRVEGRCTLGLTHEGPPMSAHGGISALLLDQLLGHAAAEAGSAGLTTDLTVRYRKPVPLGVPLRIWARVAGMEDGRAVATGAIATQVDPETPLVEAEARFRTLSMEQARRVFPALFTQSR